MNIDDIFCSTRAYVVLAVSDVRSQWAVEKCEMSIKTTLMRAIHSQSRVIYYIHPYHLTTSVLRAARVNFMESR